MKKVALSVKSCLWAGLFALLCLWTGCSSSKIAQVSSTSGKQDVQYSSEDVPQAAQMQETLANEAFVVNEAELMASNDPAVLAAIAKKVESSYAVQNPSLSRKVDKLLNKVEKQSSTGQVASLEKQAADKKFAKKLLAKAEKKFDIMKAKQGNAAQANATLVGLGALLAIVGLVLVLATSGTASTIGIVALAVGVILLIISLFAS